jgi:hypothetical protein
MASHLELGLDTFGDITAGPDDRLLTHAQVIRNVIDEAILADQLGVDFIGVGEHHRADFAVSAPEVVLAAIAGRTSRIRLGSAVTVLSSDDPVRVFQRFSTLNAASNGRAEVILGSGSFTESFPLFGYELSQYAGDGRAQDRRDGQGARCHALRHEIQRRDIVAREAPAQHRALRQQGDAAGARHAGVKSTRDRCSRSLKDSNLPPNKRHGACG